MADIFEEVKGAGKIAISGHIKPDGDCIGSCLGLYCYLRKRMPEAVIKIYLEKPDYCFRNVPKIDCIEEQVDETEVFDVFIALDTIPERMGDAYLIYRNAHKTINVDHHISNAAGCGMVNFVNPDASATAEVVYDLMNKTYVDKDIATLLYMGIAHDTGVFRFSNTSSKTLHAVADMVSYGFDFSTLIDETYYEKTYTQNMVQGQVVLDSKLLLDGKVIVGAADRELMKQFGAGKADFEGVVNQLLLTEGVEVAVFMSEREPGQFKVSLRASTDLVDVSKVAVAFDGGGHVRAAGCTLEGDKHQVEDRIVRKIAEQISE